MKWLKRLKWLRISRICIVASLVMTVVFAGFTVYGSQVGNFTINTNGKTDVALSLSMDEEMVERSSRLTVQPPKEMDNITMSDLDRSIVDGVGSKTEPNANGYGKYLAFSFFLINESKREVSYEMELKITAVLKGLDEAIRVMMIEGGAEGESFDFPGTIYAKPEKTLADEDLLLKQLYESGYDEPYETIDFESDKSVFKETITSFSEDAVVKYTLIMWLEGCDPDCNNEALSGAVKMSLEFRGY